MRIHLLKDTKKEDKKTWKDPPRRRSPSLCLDCLGVLSSRIIVLLDIPLNYSIRTEGEGEGLRWWECSSPLIFVSSSRKWISRGRIGIEKGKKWAKKRERRRKDESRSKSRYRSVVLSSFFFFLVWSDLVGQAQVVVTISVLVSLNVLVMCGGIITISINSNDLHTLKKEKQKRRIKRSWKEISRESEEDCSEDELE